MIGEFNVIKTDVKSFLSVGAGLQVFVFLIVFKVRLSYCRDKTVLIGGSVKHGKKLLEVNCYYYNYYLLLICKDS
jgi:hypothetical protein